MERVWRIEALLEEESPLQHAFLDRVVRGRWMWEEGQRGYNPIAPDWDAPSGAVASFVKGTTASGRSIDVVFDENGLPAQVVAEFGDEGSQVFAAEVVAYILAAWPRAQLRFTSQEVNKGDGRNVTRERPSWVTPEAIAEAERMLSAEANPTPE